MESSAFCIGCISMSPTTFRALLRASSFFPLSLSLSISLSVSPSISLSTSVSLPLSLTHPGLSADPAEASDATSGGEQRPGLPESPTSLAMGRTHGSHTITGREARQLCSWMHPTPPWERDPVFKRKCPRPTHTCSELNSPFTVSGLRGAKCETPILGCGPLQQGCVDGCCAWGGAGTRLGVGDGIHITELH